MKASELIKRYNEGERNFSGKCLRGQNFAGKDLSGSIFRGCDIRGTNFTGATLIETNFSQAKAGLQKRWMIGLLLAALLLSSLSSFSNAVISYFVASILDNSNVQNQVNGSLSLGVLLIFCKISYSKGLGKGIGAIAFATAIVIPNPLLLYPL
ncbi:pentapeptide repeat-containing protein [Crocosphaera sp. Alani8]|uniref:pentapeptide repeat-containing protein n=1 Tax=Crocosphaera sp. Alani8 TaxID=3038952 RepID=UPI00313AF88D